MAGEIITTQDLVDAKVDAKDLGEAVNEDKVITPRYGDSYKSLPMAMRELTDAIDVAAAAGAGANGWTDLVVKTRDGRTQRQVNDENITVVLEQQKSYTEKSFGTYQANSFVNLDHLRSIQTQKYARFLQKLHTGQHVDIHCIGTSITEGMDEQTQGRVQAPNSGGSWTVSPITYPQALQNLLREIYKNTTTNVWNYGVIGHTAQQSYNRWTENNRVCDLTIIELGANDSSTNVAIETFVFYLEQSIIRELIMGNPVVLMQPSKQREANSLNRDSYSNAIYAMSNKYCLNVIDTEKFLKNCDTTFYSDGVHLNLKGYQYIAAKVAATLCGDGIQNKRSVQDGTKLLSRPTIDGIIYGDYATKETTASVGRTPAETNANGNGIMATLRGNLGTAYLYYAFYAETDDLMIIPNMYVDPDTELTFTLDGGVGAPSDSIKFAIEEPESTVTDSNIWTYKSTQTEGFVNTSRNRLVPAIKVRTEGWHLLKIEAKVKQATIYGLEFMSNRSYLNLIRPPESRRVIKVVINIEQSTLSISQTRIPYSEVVKAFGDLMSPISFEYWMNPALKASFVAPTTGLAEANFTLGTIDDPVSWGILGAATLKKRGSSLDADCRQISSVSFDTSTQELIINWSGFLKRRGTLCITLA